MKKKDGSYMLISEQKKVLNHLESISSKVEYAAPIFDNIDFKKAKFDDNLKLALLNLTGKQEFEVLSEFARWGLKQYEI